MTHLFYHKWGENIMAIQIAATPIAYDAEAKKYQRSQKQKK